MTANFIETRDSSGLTVVEMNDHGAGILVWACIVVTAGALFWPGDVVKLFLLWLLLMAGVSAVYFFTRKHARIIIDQKRRLLRLNRRSIRLDEILRAELATWQDVKDSGPGGAKFIYYRVDLVLRSGERVPTSRGFGQFQIDDCRRLVDLINAAAATRP